MLIFFKMLYLTKIPVGGPLLTSPESDQADPPVPPKGPSTTELHTLNKIHI